MTLYDYALSFFGNFYQWGGDGPPRDWGFDCSGYVSKILLFGGIKLAWRHNAAEIHELFKSCPPGLKPNALAFFGTPGTVDHVGFMLDDKIMISAAGGGHTCITPATTTGSIKIQPVSFYGSKFLGAYLPGYKNA